MARLEVPVRTSLRFRTGGRVPALIHAPAPDSVEFVFAGRTFGWVMPELAEPNAAVPGPTVTTLVDPDTAEAWHAAHEATQRLLSALAFHFQTRLDAEPLAGGSGESDLLHPYGAQAPADTVGAYLAPAPREIVVEDDAQLRLALAVNREALNASSPFYAFLAYWNVLEVVFDADGAKRNNFLRQEVANTYQRPTFVAGQDIATYLRDESRHAIAHVIRTSPTDTAIDPDLPLDRGRLEKDRSLMREFAHKATLSRWRRPVTLLDGED